MGNRGLLSSVLAALQVPAAGPAAGARRSIATAAAAGAVPAGRAALYTTTALRSGWAPAGCAPCHHLDDKMPRKRKLAAGSAVKPYAVPHIDR